MFSEISESTWRVLFIILLTSVLFFEFEEGVDTKCNQDKIKNVVTDILKQKEKTKKEKIMASCKSGLLRGCVSGALNNGINGMISNGVLFGLTNPIITYITE